MNQIKDPVYLQIAKEDLELRRKVKGLAYARWDHELKLWEVSRSEIDGAADFSSVPVFSAEEIKERRHEMQVEANTDKQVREIAERIYLDLVPSSLMHWIKNPKSGVKFDSAKKQYYLSREDALKPANSSFLAKCRRRRLVAANDFGPGELTPGKKMLADALNLTDFAQREMATADALAICAKEAALQIPGAITSFNAVLAADKMAGRRIGFAQAFAQAKNFYVALNQEKRAANSHTTDPEFKERQVRSLLRIRAAKNIKESLPGGIAYAAKNSDLEAQKAFVSKVLYNYANAHQTAIEETAKSGRAGFVAHNPQAFIHEIDAAAKSVLNLNNPSDLEMYQSLMAMSRKTSATCSKMDFCGKKLINALCGKAPPEEGINADNALEHACEELLRDFEKFNLHGVEHDIPSKGSATPVLDGSQEPLFIAASYEERKFLRENYGDKLKIDPVHYALCVENTPENRNLFAPYLPTSQPALNFQRSYEELRSRALQALIDNNFSISSETLKTDGHWHSDPQDKSKSYVINLADGAPRMQLFDYNGSLNETIMLGVLSEKERRELKDSYAKHKANQDALNYQEQIAAAESVRTELTGLPAIPVDFTHQYLKNKGLTASDLTGCLYDPDGEKIKKLLAPQSRVLPSAFKNHLIFPLINDAGKIQAVQIINSEGEKRFVRKAPVSGSFFAVGGYEKLCSAKAILIAEGVATAASIAKFVPEDTSVVACMSAGNMEAVTLSLARRFPRTGIGLCADNDMKSAGIDKINAGLTHSMRAKKAVTDFRPELVIARPPLTTKEMLQGNSDFNDAMRIDAQRTAKTVTDAVLKVKYGQKLANEAYDALAQTAQTHKKELKQLEIQGRGR